MNQKKYSSTFSAEYQLVSKFISWTPAWTTFTCSVTITVFTRLKMSGWISSSASKMVTTSPVAYGRAALSPCGLLIGPSSNTTTLTLFSPCCRSSLIFSCGRANGALVVY